MSTNVTTNADYQRGFQDALRRVRSIAFAYKAPDDIKVVIAYAESDMSMGELRHLFSGKPTVTDHGTDIAKRLDPRAVMLKHLGIPPSNGG